MFVAERVMRLLSVGRRNTGVEYETHLAYYFPSLKEYRTVPHYSTQIAYAKTASDKMGSVVIFAPSSSVRDGSYANRKKDWLVEIIPHGGTTNDAVWAYGETEELARCLAALKMVELEA
jgi:hypothetical protein